MKRRFITDAMTRVRDEFYGIDAAVATRAKILMGYTHRHNECEINLLVSGRAKYFFKDRVVNIPVGRLMIFWATTPHSLVEASEDVVFMVADIPLEYVLQWGLPAAFIHRLLAGEICVDKRDADWSVDQCMLSRWSKSDFRSDAYARRILLLEAEARLMRLAMESEPATVSELPPAGGKSSEKVIRMLQFMGRNYAQDIHIADVAAAVGLHPNYAVTLFKKFCGSGIQQYLTQIRLSHAERMLITGDETVLSIALASGFNSASQFYTEFARKHPFSPNRYRKKMTGHA